MMKAPGFALTWKATRADVARIWRSRLHRRRLRAHDEQHGRRRPSTEKGKFLTTWKKINGAWKVIEDTGSPTRRRCCCRRPSSTPAATIKWMDAPPFLPKGAKLAVLVGDPSKPEPFTLRLQMPDGYKIAPHTHPTDEHVTVLSGVLRAGMGTKWDDKALGDFARRQLREHGRDDAALRAGEGRDGRAGARHRPVRRQLRQSRGRSVEGEVASRSGSA